MASCAGRAADAAHGSWCCPPLASVFQDFTRRIGPRGTRDVAAGVCSRPAEPQAGDRHAIALELADGAQEKHLIQGHLALMPLAASKAELTLDILGSQNFSGQYAARQIGRALGQESQCPLRHLPARVLIRGPTQA